MTATQFKTWLRQKLLEAMPIDRPSEMDNPRSVAEFAAKRLGYYGFGSGQIPKIDGVNSPKDCAVVLSDCLAVLNEAETSQVELATNAELLTVKQASQRYNISQRMLYRLLQKNKLRNYGPESSKRIKPSDMERYLEEQGQPATSVGSLFD